MEINVLQALKICRSNVHTSRMRKRLSNQLNSGKLFSSVLILAENRFRVILIIKFIITMNKEVSLTLQESG